jgi:4-amino-4-deoxy-L-arabinose transferase-like glycosyltransferase
MRALVANPVSSLAERWQISRSVVAIAILTVAGLLMLSNQYGFHRDELYFIVAGQHPDWGYVDQPPLTPILSALGVGIFGVTPFAVRLLPAVTVGICATVAAFIARDMGGGARVQAVAALTTALSGFLLAGHLAATATYDLLFWTLITWLAVRILGGGDQRLWLAIGVLGGIAMLNKYTIALLPVGLALGLLLERKWSVLRPPWLYIGVAVALLIASPNLIWQVTHGFPELDMARHIAAATGEENRSQLVLLQLILAGPVLFPIAVIGLAWLIAARRARPWRALAWAYLVALVLTYEQGGKAYYVMGLFPILFAAGSIPVGAWLGGRLQWLRMSSFAGAAAISGSIMALIVLPILPPASLASSGILDINKESGEQIGWPELATAVDEAVAGLSNDERAHAAIITANYGEAGAIELLLANHPPVFSGHNSYADWGRPADDTKVVILVGQGPAPGVGDCQASSYIDNEFGIPNDEQGMPIAVCRAMPSSWADIWPLYQHLD